MIKFLYKYNIIKRLSNIIWDNPLYSDVNTDRCGCNFWPKGMSYIYYVSPPNNNNINDNTSNRKGLRFARFTISLWSTLIKNFKHHLHLLNTLFCLLLLRTWWSVEDEGKFVARWLIIHGCYDFLRLVWTYSTVAPTTKTEASADQSIQSWWVSYILCKANPTGTVKIEEEQRCFLTWL